MRRSKRLRKDADIPYGGSPLEQPSTAVEPRTPPIQRTGGDVDMDSASTGVGISLSEVICYGAIFPSTARLNSSEIFSVRRLPWDRFHLFSVQPRGEQYHFTSSPSLASNQSLGILDTITVNRISYLRHLTGLTFEVVVPTAAAEGLNKREKTANVEVSVNIMGPYSLFESVGAAFEKASTHLQHPIFLLPGIRYVNPQYLYFDGDNMDLRHLVGPRVDNSQLNHISRFIENALTSLDHPTGLLGGDSSPSLPSSCLATELKSHQRDGVRFILSREDPSWRRTILSEMKSYFGSHIFSDVDSFCAGGILADDMGLGKTLTMLSAIMASQREAFNFASKEAVDESTQRIATRATLVVLPSLQLLNVWELEIQKHFVAGSLSTVVFHGGNRTKSPRDLLNCGVVLTTYATLVADHKGHKVIGGIDWFRVVLDEAHWIRNQSSTQFMAATEVSSGRRWGITGTPIQNSLDDLRSLLKFLRVQPFSGNSVFNETITQPLYTNSAHGSRNLQLLLRAVCIRRNKDQIFGPSTAFISQVIQLSLSPDEQVVQSRILESCQSQLDSTVSGTSKNKKFAILFSTLIRLRQLCSHGHRRTYQSSSTPENPTTTAADSTIASKLGCEFCSGRDEGFFSLLERTSTCPECLRDLSGNHEDSRKSSPASPSMPSTSRAESLCPKSIDALASGPGVSSKLTAVANNLESQHATSKSIVFSAWLATLDALAAMLQHRGIYHLQIDGRASHPDRRLQIARFQNDPDVRALLISIGTGAVGLTLTAATRVHIVEPQWNPAVEAQAIGRVVRIGQTETVTVIRYITRNSVEQAIAMRQQAKEHIATLSLNSYSAAGEDPLEYLKSILQFGA